MSGITGIFNTNLDKVPGIERKLKTMNELMSHRGPDGEGIWVRENGGVGFGHRRLSIVDDSTRKQPMQDASGNWITYDGEIYNHLELRKELGEDQFSTNSDTEVILVAYRKWGRDCVKHFRGIFSFLLWDQENRQLFCARDHFGSKPLYYYQSGSVIFFASEVKSILPFVKEFQLNLEALKEYLVFQFYLEGKTLFQEVRELQPAHTLTIGNGKMETEKFWEVYFDPDFTHTAMYFEEHLRELIEESVRLHTREDIPMGAYLSGGVDSSTVASLASRYNPNEFMGFTGKFSEGPEFDESTFAREVAKENNFLHKEIVITADEFIGNIRKVIYHMDYPAAGPGAFPQYMVSKAAAKHRKVVFCGHGGDEIFGGYARYLIAYFEQCIKAAIFGTADKGNFIVTYESIIPNLKTLRNYTPMLQKLWRDELFAPMDRRYFRLVNRADAITDEIQWDILEEYSAFQTFSRIFNGPNVHQESYFDLMTNFDFKTLLPALSHVEDRMSMAHGTESRTPLLDYKIVEFAAKMPSNVKFKDGTLKHILREAARPYIPDVVYQRRDKMGFPTPLSEWVSGPAKTFILDIFNSKNAQQREYINTQSIIKQLEKEPRFSRKIWGFLCLEIWFQEFMDKESDFRAMGK